MITARRDRRAGAAAAVIIPSLVAMTASPALAWTPISADRPTWSTNVPYAIEQRGSEDLGGFAPTAAVVQQAMEDWGSLACTNITFEYIGPTTDVPFDRGHTVVGWIEADWIDSPSAIGVTAPMWTLDGRIVDAHMALNGVDYRWGTTPGDGSDRVDTYSIVLHEAGHYYGLGHSDSRDATMFYAYTGGRFNLNGDDQAGICSLYPGSLDASADDCTSTGCPDGQRCVDARCVTDAVEPPPSGCDGDAACTATERCDLAAARCVPRDPLDLGDPCELNEQCGSGMCAIDNDRGRSFCTDTCGDGSPCPGGYACEAVGGGVSICNPMLGTLGSSCDGPPDCLSGLCAVGATGQQFCTEPCGQDGSCPLGFECVTAAADVGRVCAATPTRDAALHGQCTVGAAPGAGREGPPAPWLVACLALALLWRRSRRATTVAAD